MAKGHGGVMNRAERVCGRGKLGFTQMSPSIAEGSEVAENIFHQHLTNLLLR